MPPQPARQCRQIQAGSDADDQRVTQTPLPGRNRFPHLLRLDGQEQHIRRVRCVCSLGITHHPVGLMQAGARFAARVDHLNFAGGNAFVEHAADQGIGHIAATKEENVHA